MPEYPARDAPAFFYSRIRPARAPAKHAWIPIFIPETAGFIFAELSAIASTLFN